MNRTVGGAVVLLLALPLAGCIGGAPVEEPTSELTSEKAEESPKIGSKATSWVRDRWGNRSEITIFEGTVDASEILHTHDMAVPPPGVAACVNCRSEMFSPSDGKLVLPGTDRIEAEITWDDPTVDGVGISWWLPGRELDSVQREPAGYNETDEQGTVTIDVGPNRTDAPLDDTSDWHFVLWPDTQGTHPDLEIDVTLTIVRNASLPQVPPPPDPWDGRNWLLLYDNATDVNQYTGLTPGAFVCPPVCTLEWIPRPGPVVPADASKVRAVLTWDPTLSVSGSLAYRAGDGPTSMERVEQGDGRAVFEAEVPPEATDSPYQVRSDWYIEGRLEGRDQPVGAFIGPVVMSVKVLRGNATT